MTDEDINTDEGQKLLQPKVILLDVYQTLLDMKDVEKKLNHLFHSNKGYTLWTGRMLQYFYHENNAKKFHEFDVIAKAAMETLAKETGVRISEEEKENVIQLLKFLPLKEGIQEVLSQFQDSGYELAALTNTSTRIITDRMELTGLVSHFKTILSTEEIKKYKPGIETYLWAAKKANVNAEDVLLISSHSWDIHGATQAGMMTAYIYHTSESLYPFAPSPTLIVNELSEVLNHLKH